MKKAAAPKKKAAAPKKRKSGARRTGAASKKTQNPSARLLALVVAILDDGKAEDVFVIDLAGKSSMADFMVVASGGTARQINALA